MREIGRVDPGFVAFHAAEEFVGALAVALKNDVPISRGMQDSGQRVSVVEKLVAPTVKCAIDSKGIEKSFLRIRDQNPVVRAHDPVEIRGRKAKNSLGTKDSSTFRKKRQAIVETKMLEKMLCVNRVDVGVVQAIAYVEHSIDLRQRLAVDVLPSLEAMVPAANVKTEMRFVTPTASEHAPA